MSGDGLLHDKSGVAPVIGVILMVAITVLLGAVIGMFIFNMDTPEDSAPGVKWLFEEKDDKVILRHDGGDRVPAKELSLIVEYDGASTQNIPIANNGNPNRYGTSEQLISSDTFVLNESVNPPGEYGAQLNENVSDVAEMKLIWESSETGDTSEIVGRFSP